MAYDMAKENERGGMTTRAYAPVCSVADCQRAHKSRGYCTGHLAQFERTGGTWPIKDRARPLTDAEVDQALLLVARGRATDEVAAEVGLSNGRQLKRQLRRQAPDAWRAAWSAAMRTPHGTRGRYGAGCRCVDCKQAQSDYSREVTAAQQREKQRRSLSASPRRGYQWTGPEIEIAARTDLTPAQAAQMLGRSVYGVLGLRARLRTGDPRLTRQL